VVIATLAHFAPKVNVKSGFPLRSRGNWRPTMPDTELSFSELLNAAYDFNSPPPDLTALAPRKDVVAFIQGFTRERPPSFPTTAIAQDLMRTFGEIDGKALLSWASQLWDDTPLTVEQVDAIWFDPDEAFEPQAWERNLIIHPCQRDAGFRKRQA
jgi:hypothetical protein